MITTKKGDGGETSLYDGKRVSKDDARIELNGELDELNAWLGLCKATAQQTEPYEKIQRELMILMGIVANGYPSNGAKDDLPEVLNILHEATNSMEAHIKRMTQGKKFHFVFPGKDMTDAVLHLTRTQVRTCERRLVTLSNLGKTDAQSEKWRILMQYINRLSDYLYCLSNP